MDESTAGDWSIERVRTITVRLATELADRDPAAAGRLAEAATSGVIPAESLLEMRSALISTRAAWESSAASELVDEGRAAIAAGKRLSIDDPT